MQILFYLGAIGVGITIGHLTSKYKSNKGIHWKLNLITEKLFDMSEKTDKALQDLTTIQGQLQKISAESTATLEKVKALEDAANANSDTPQEVLDKIAEVKTSIQALDDLTPDLV